MFGCKIRTLCARIHSEPADTLLSLHRLAMTRIETTSLTESIATVFVMRCPRKVRILKNIVCIDLHVSIILRLRFYRSLWDLAMGIMQFLRKSLS